MHAHSMNKNDVKWASERAEGAAPRDAALTRWQFWSFVVWHIPHDTLSFLWWRPSVTKRFLIVGFSFGQNYKLWLWRVGFAFIPFFLSYRRRKCRHTKKSPRLSEIKSQWGQCTRIIPQSCRNTEAFTPSKPSEFTEAPKSHVACQAVFIECPLGSHVLILWKKNNIIFI